jgi:hypothetical protein
MGESGRQFVRREFLRESLAQRYLHLLTRLAHPSAPLVTEPHPASESQ